MAKILASLAVLAMAFAMVGCGPPDSIGQSEINKAYPKQSEDQIKQALANDPKALQEYENSKAKDKAYLQAGQGAGNETPSGPTPGR